MNRRHTTRMAAAAVALATAFGASSALAMAGSDDSLTVQNSATSQTYTYSQNGAMPDQGNVIVTTPQPLYLPDEPRFTPETGDAQYGSKVAPYTYGPSANRFNDATGQ